MAFTTTSLPYSRHNYFLYYANATDTNLEENLMPAFSYELHTVRLNLSVIHASVVDFIVRLSSGQNSAHNTILLSVAMSDLDKYRWFPSIPFIFNKGDHINFSMDCANANTFGLAITGWAITS